MREVILAKTAGFCFGVKRAIDTVYNEISPCDKDTKIFTYGPIIHNEEVVKDLESRGVVTIDEDIELAHYLQGDFSKKVIIRSHGVGKAVYDQLADFKAEIIDATCPFVKKIHKIVNEESIKGNEVIIIGDKTHPEVIGIKGWCVSEPIIVDSIQKAEDIALDKDKSYVIVAQTTFNSIKFKELVEIFTKKYYNVYVYSTICNATEERQKEARELASNVDTMIVIGGKSSSNTQKLYDISKKECNNTYYIQTLVDLDLTVIESAKRVGITAGASTPNHIIKEVQNSMSELSFEELLNQSEENGNAVRHGSVIEGKHTFSFVFLYPACKFGLKIFKCEKRVALSRLKIHLVVVEILIPKLSDIKSRVRNITAVIVSHAVYHNEDLRAAINTSLGVVGNVRLTALKIGVSHTLTVAGGGVIDVI